MKLGDRVGWMLKDGTTGSGRLIGLKAGGGHVLVAVDPVDPSKFPGRTFAQSSLEFHPVIYCSATWLTVLGDG